jgi:hypothetical protein
MNLEKNWGNTVVIKHAEGLYSQISHLKKDSIKVNFGQDIKEGDVIGSCGNSGRSLKPHVHLQFQSTPSIGSKTINYPFSSYIAKTNSSVSFKTTSKPQLNQVVSNIKINDLLKKAYHFIPGENVEFEVEKGDGKEIISWKVKSDIFNNTFFECESSGAIAWFKELGSTYYFTYYQGKKDTLLYYFFLSSFKVVQTFDPKLKIEDNFPLSIHPDKKLLFVQDFFIPFTKFLKAQYEMVYHSMNSKDAKQVILKSSARFGKNKTSFDFNILIGEKGISKMEIISGQKTITANRIF